MTAHFAQLLQAPRVVERFSTPPPLAAETSEAPTVAGAFRACRGALWGVFAISFVTNLLMLTGPLFMLQVYDRVLSSGSMETLVALVLLVTGLFTFMGLLELIRSRILTLIGLRIDRLLGKALFDSVLKVKSAVSGSSQTQALRDLEQIRHFAGGGILPAAFDAPWAPFYFAIIFLFHYVLGFVALGGALLLVILSALNEFMTRRPVAEAAKLSLKTLDLAEAGRRNAETLHAMGMAEDYSRRWLQQHRKSLAAQLGATQASIALVVTTKIFRLFLQSFILAAGAYLAILHEVTPGVMVAASIIMSRALSPIEQLTSQWRSILSVRQAIPRIEQQLKQEGTKSGRIMLPNPRGHLSLSGVYASPLGSTEIILKNLNFSLQPGQAIAVVGPSASGKSTLARVLVGVWPIRQGEVRLDGASLDHWDAEQFGRHIGYLPQDIVLFDGTVAENISRFDPRCTERGILTAAMRANVHELILRLPDGYATRVGEGGAVLSGGQRQRIALARALYGDPRLIVLDEPNANLDLEGEQALCRSIMQLRRDGRTVVVIAHRPSVIGAVDQLLVMRDGRQIGFGPRDQVLREVLNYDVSEQNGQNVPSAYNA
jgi:PrtD family type I secretion system ABC transporter